MSKEKFIVETKDLTKAYRGNNVVESLDLKIKEGEIYGFLGPNGAGKTTTIRMLLGLIESTKGEIQILGKSLKEDRLSILREVGSLVESPSYYPHLTGEQNLEILRKILNVPKSRIEQVLSMVRLTKVADKKVKEYSLGMKQRLGIAAALLGNPRLLILDEPTNGLDPAGIIEIRKLIKQLPESHGITVMISSHLLSEIEELATHVGIITRGKMIFQDSLDQLKKKANHKIFLYTSDLDKTEQVLREEKENVSRNTKGIFIDYCNDDKIWSLVEKLIEQNIRVYRIVEEKVSLEKIFLDLTRSGQTL